MKNDDILYFDAAATVPMIPAVVQAITQAMNTVWGNPSSAHILGQKAHERMEDARSIVAAYIGCDPEEIIFTPSASAANNLAIRGLCQGQSSKRILTTEAEHKSILETCQAIHNLSQGVYHYIHLKDTGAVDFRDLEDWLDAWGEGTLVSIGMASSELGTIQDIKYIGDLVHMYGGILHVDATQCFTKMPIDIRNIDMMTVGGSKIGAGKGIGVLYKKKDIKLSSLIYGGGQEYGLIAGTEDVPKMIGLAAALQLTDYQSLENQRDYFIKRLDEFHTEHRINGDPERHLDNLISVSFKDRHGEDIVTACSDLGLCISAGSACSSGSPEPSKALKAIGIPEDYINGTVRISMLQGTTNEDIDRAIEILEYVVDTW